MVGRARMGLLVAALALIVVLSVATLSSPLATAQSSTIPQVLPWSLTNVYNLVQYSLPQQVFASVKAATYLPGSNVILVSGPGAYGIGVLNPTTRTLSLESVGALIGIPNNVFYDSSGSPRWYGFSTNSGELLLVNSTDLSYIKAYYTATRTPAVAEALASYASGTSLVAVDSEGYAYFYKVPSDYWLEIGPTAHDTALASLPYFKFNTLFTVKRLSWTGESVSPKVALEVSNDTYRGAASITIEYYNSTSGKYEAALAGSTTANGITTVKTINIYLVSPTGLVIYKYTNTSSTTNTYYLKKLPAGNWNLITTYLIQEFNSTTGALISSTCYYLETQAIIPPLQPVDLGTVKLSTTTTTLDAALAAVGATDLGKAAVLNEYLIVNTSTLNETTIYSPPVLNGTLQLSFLPVPSYAAGFPTTLVEAYKPITPPPSWPTGATTLLLVGKGRYLLIYLLDDNMLPLPISNTSLTYVEVADMGSPVTSATIDPLANSIYVGSQSGRIVMLRWSPYYGKYLASNSYLLDTSPVTSLAASPDGKLLIAGSANGILQLINTTSWEPLWRGPPGYTGITTGLANVVINSGLPGLLFMYSPGKQSVEIFYNPVQTLVPAVANVTLTLATLNGTIQPYPVPDGSNVTVYNSTTGAPEAYTILEGGQGTLYLPLGSYKFNVNLAGLGSISLEEQVTYPEAVLPINVTLRQVIVYAYTPSKTSNPQTSPGYYLVSGPKPDTLVTAKPLSYDTNLGYTPSPLISQGTTGSDGTTILLLWEGVSYTVTGQLQGYYSSPTQIPYYGVGNYSLVMNPQLSAVTFSLVDSDSLQAGKPFYIPQATIYLAYKNTGRNVALQITSANQTYYLPPGDYHAIIEAPHYNPTAKDFTVTLPQTTVEAILTPLTYTLTLQAFSSDPTSLGIGNGPLGGARVSITMIWPIPGYVNATLYTDSRGMAITPLRYGLYKITVSSPYTVTRQLLFLLGSDTNKTVTLKLKTTDLYLVLRDSEYTAFPVNNATVTLTYVGSSWSSSITLPANESLLHVTAPYGEYQVTVKAPFYSPTTIQLVLAQSIIQQYIYVKPAYVSLTVQVLYNTTSGLAQGPVQNSKVTLKLLKPTLPIGSISGITGSDGRVTLFVREGVYEISVENPYTTGNTSIATVNNSAIITLTVAPLKANLTVRISDLETNKPIPGATLEITRVQPGSQVTETYTINGSASLTVPAGEYVVKAYIPERYSPSQATISLAPGMNTTVSLGLAPLRGTLRLDVYTSQATITVGGKTYILPPVPLKGAKVTLIPVDPLLEAVYNRTLTFYTGPDGSLIASTLRTGSYRLVVSYPGFTSEQYIVSIMPETPLYINATLKANTSKVTIVARDNELVKPVLDSYILEILSYEGSPVTIAIPLSGEVTLSMPDGNYTAVITREYYVPYKLSFNPMTTTTVEANLTAVTYTVKITLTVDNKPYKGPVDNVTLVAESLSWKLKNPFIKVNVSNGEATLSLRPGSYKLYLASSYYGVNMSLGKTTIKENTTLQYLVKPESVSVTLRFMDQDLRKPVYTPITLYATYAGPFGKASLTLQNLKPEATLKLVPGKYVLIISSEAYNTKTLAVVVKKNETLTFILAPYRVAVALSLVDIDGKPVLISNATVIFKHVETGEILPGKIVEGKIIPYKGLRLGTYTLTIIPPQTAYINTTTVTINVTRNGVTPTTIVAAPRFYKLSIILYDPVAKAPAKQPFTVTITRSGGKAEQYGLPLTATVKNGVLNVTLPYGVYTVTVKGGHNSYFLDPKPVIVSLYSSKTLRIDLTPKQYKIVIYVVDDRGKPLQGAFVTISRNGKVVATGPTDELGSYTFTGTYGSYTVEATAPGYKTGYSAFKLPGPTSIQVRLEPGPKVIFKRYLPLLIGVIGLAAFAGFFYVARDRIMSRLSEEEEYF